MSGINRFQLSLTKKKQLEIKISQDLVNMKSKFAFLNNQITQQCANSEIGDVLSIINRTEQLLLSRAYINDEKSYNELKDITNRFQPIEKKIIHKQFKHCLNEDLNLMNNTYEFINNPVNEQRAKKELDDIKLYIDNLRDLHGKDHFTDKDLSRNFLKEFDNLEQKFRKKIIEFHDQLDKEEKILKKAKSSVEDKINTLKIEFNITDDNDVNKWSRELAKNSTQMERVDEIKTQLDKKIEQKIQFLKKEEDRKIRVDTFKQALVACNEYSEIIEDNENDNIVLKATKKEKGRERLDTFIFSLNEADIVNSNFQILEDYVCSVTTRKILNHLYDLGLVNDQGSVDCQTMNTTITISKAKIKNKKKTKSYRNKTQNYNRSNVS